MSRLMFIMFLTVLMGFSASPAGAYRAGGVLNLSVDVVVQRQGGPNEVLCRQELEVLTANEIKWYFGLFDGGRKSSCDASPEVPAGQEEGVELPQYDWIAEGRIKAVVRPRMEGERVLEVDFETNTGAGPLAAEGDIENAQTRVQQRSVVFADDGWVYVWLTDPDGLGIPDLIDADIFLRVGASVAIDREHSEFGAIRITGISDGDHLRLDGGKLSGQPPIGDWVVELIPEGIHALELETPGGTSSMHLIRVTANRTAVAAFGSRPEPPGVGLEPMGENGEGFMQYRRAKDNAVVIQVPGGKYLMGNSETERSPLEHEVFVPAFLIDKLGVTWGQYKQFASETGTKLPPHDPYWGIEDDEPAAYVTWAEARAYCQWAGARLPSEAEREKAARGTDGRMFPWGDEQPNPELAVFRVGWGYGGPGKVGARPAGASPYGALDMGGNMWEWCEDWYQEDYFASSPIDDPQGPATGIAHVVKGGSWDSRPTVLSASSRNWGHRGYRDGDFGFRCAMDAATELSGPSR